GAGGNSATCVRLVLGRHRVGVHDGVAPLVEVNHLGDELRAEPAAVARDRVDAEPLAHRTRPAEQRLRRWRSTSEANTVRALRRNRLAPSGCAHAPRPSTRAARLRRRSTTLAPASQRAREVAVSAIARSPN